MNRIAYFVSAALGLVAGIVGLAGLTGHGWSVTVPWLVPLTGFDAGLDRLSAFFLALVGLSTVPVSIYAVGYAGHERDGGLPYLGFVVSMCLVPMAGNLMTFLIAWELMALASYLLVVQGGGATHGAPTDDPARVPHQTGDERVRAGWAYLVMAHAGLACVLAGMLLLASWTGSARFADWRGATLPPLGRDVAFVLLGLGFASKAGVIPLHVWLPLAHPAAPSHASALMSGVMIKLGIYGLVRIGVDWLAPAPAWWGIAMLLAGATSAVVGALYALVERDLKRLLAFSSIENVGIILIALGAGMLFHTHGLAELGVLALAAALYHVANHASFKALLFAGAGAVVRATGTRDIEAFGGLARRMPWTAATFLLGSVAISALPPLNGFVSEWLIFQSLLQSIRVPNGGLGLVFVIGMAGLALTSGLAMAAFVKAFGITFLAMPRSEAAARATEAPVSMRAGMVLLAIAALALGLGPTVVVPVLGGVAEELIGQGAPLVFGDWLRLDVPGEFASLSTLSVAIALVVGLLVPIAVLRAGGHSRRRYYETWGCGRMLQTARMEYTATAFASPFRRIFHVLYRPAHALEVDAHPESRFFVDGVRYAHETRAVVDDWLYRPVGRVLHVLTDHARHVQSGSATTYLAYILAALVLLLVLR